jgi:glycosyltransferase involved in cell wall biosynthesis
MQNMHNQPFVSVCTPVFNGEQFLEECIKGVLNQTYANFEYIIVDNASTDSTLEIIAKYKLRSKKIRTYRNKKTIPIIDNFNTCAKYISSDSKWIKYAFADDYLFPNCLEEMVKVGEKDNEIGLVSAYRLYGSRATNFGLPIDQNIFNGPEILKGQLQRKLHVCSGSPNTVMYRRKVFNELNGFNNNFLHADTELALRIIDRYKLGFVHYFLTRTGLHQARGEAYSLRHGIVIKEYMDFGFKNLDRYESVHLPIEDMSHLAEVYANEILSYIATNIVYFRFKNINELLSEAPREIKSQLFKSVTRNWRKYLKNFARAIYRYKDR